jgi:hypothetical protein
MLKKFLAERCEHRPESLIAFSDFYSRFLMWLDPDLRVEWTRRRVSDNLPERHKTITRGQNITFIKNLHWRSHAK